MLPAQDLSIQPLLAATEMILAMVSRWIRVAPLISLEILRQPTFRRSARCKELLPDVATVFWRSSTPVDPRLYSRLTWEAADATLPMPSQSTRQVNRFLRVLPVLPTFRP